MRLISLQLRNYRVYRELDLELPGGVVGIYGANGSGKSTLLESITWVLFGKARTQKQQLPSSGSTGECSVTLVFEHEGHHYTVRRSISGAAFNVKARVLLGDQVAADGPSDVDRYLQSVLGMDATAFRASVFAEQKQLAAFSDQAPDKRRQMVLQLLGITPVERARDAARTQARDSQTLLERSAPLLSSVADAEAKVVATLAAVATAATADAEAERLAVQARTQLSAARDAVDALNDARAADALIREKGNAVRVRLDDLSTRIGRVSAERDAIAAEQTTDETDADVGLTIERLAELVRLHQAAALIDTRLAGLSVPAANASPTDTDITDARTRRDALALELASLRGQLDGARAQVATATAHVNETSTLDGADACPMCGQELGESVTQMRQHRVDELQSATQRAAAIQSQIKARSPELEQATALLQRYERAAQQAEAAAKKAATITAERHAQEQLLADAVGAIEAFGLARQSPSGLAELERQLTAARDAAQRRAAARARFERLPQLDAELVELQGARDTAAAERTALLAELKALNFDPSRFAALASAAQAAEASTETARMRAVAAGKALATQQALAAAASEALELVQAQHAAVAEQREKAAVLMRTASLLHDFRQYIVGLVGPQLQVQASELFNQLTAHEYDGLEVDPDTYEMRVIDHGTAHPMSRFSGSEIDLANLALRVAISEQVRFQAGGQVGLLVLDEALSSLDADRKDKTLASLAQLGGRFQQILVVTHAPEVKEQLPQAIEVIRTGVRQSTARVIDAGV